MPLSRRRCCGITRCANVFRDTKRCLENEFPLTWRPTTNACFGSDPMNLDVQDSGHHHPPPGRLADAQLCQNINGSAGLGRAPKTLDQGCAGTPLGGSPDVVPDSPMFWLTLNFVGLSHLSLSVVIPKHTDFHPSCRLL